MGHQRTRRDRSLLDGSSHADTGSDATRSGVWDVDGSTDLASSADAEGVQSTDEAERSLADETEEDGLVTVDRDKLTDRQLEVLETAHEMGYYQYPRGANATEVAEALDICPSTLAEHLAAAQTKLLADVLDEPDA